MLLYSVLVGFLVDLCFSVGVMLMFAFFNSFLFFVFSIFLISFGRRPISIGFTNFVSLTSFKL